MLARSHRKRGAGRLPAAVLSAGAVLALAAGCGRRESVVSFQYNRPAEFRLPAGIKRIAIADLGGTTDRDKSWGGAVSDSLTALAGSAPIGGRNWEVVRLAGFQRSPRGILSRLGGHFQPTTDSSKPQTAPASAPADSASQPTGADAMIVGWANVMVRDEQVAIPPAAPLPRGAATQTAMWRYAVGTADLRMIDMESAEVLASVRITEQFDSLGRVGPPSPAVSKPAPGAGEPAPVGEVLHYLAERTARQFLARFAPRRVTVSQALKEGPNQRVQSGNRAASRGEYAKALKRYQDAIQADPMDDAALFDAALMCEALGRLDEAATYADRAAVLRDDNDYLRLGRRARGELPD